MRYLPAVAALITALAAATAVGAQQPSAKPPLVGWLRISQPVASGDKLLTDLLAARGHIAGRTIRFETRSADGEVNRFPALARELVGEGAAVLITFGSRATRAARDETTAIPIVAATDLVGWGLASMASPGGNVTGVHIHNAELDVKKLEILKELLPTSRRIGVLSDASALHSAQPIDDAARALGFELTTVAVKDPTEFGAAFETFAKASVNAVNISSTTLLASSFRLGLAPLLRRHSIPAICEWREMAASGCLASYGVTQNEFYTLIANHVDSIMKGAKPADLPIVQPTRFELVINKAVAREMGLTIQQRMLELADEVIE